MDRQRYFELLTDVVNSLPDKTGEGGNLVPIFLAGNMTHSEFYFSLIEEAGAIVVQDDLCSGTRFLRLMVPEDMDPIEGLTHRYFTSFLCPTKHQGPYAHIETLLKEVQNSGAKGVIFLLYKYCETHFSTIRFETGSRIKRDRNTEPEVEDPSSSIGQLKTRIQAFVEMLSPI
jgi:benzoyl-CoA reductase/2-hydroxyglutaryl-CoA dehydratase subunit BcrC/BadD/HgdB